LFSIVRQRREVIEYPAPMQSTIHVYEVRPRKDKRGVDPVSPKKIFVTFTTNHPIIG
jgi:hypothetical protein